VQDQRLEVFKLSLVVPTDGVIQETLERDKSRHRFHQEVKSKLEEALAETLEGDIRVLL